MWPTLITLILLIPILSLLGSFGTINNETIETWNHLIENQLGEATVNTVGLLIVVGIGTLTLGTSLSYLVATFQFPLRRTLRWALLLPLAFPPYVFSFIFLGFFSPTAKEGTFNQLASWTIHHPFFSLALVMILCFYPYIYLLGLNAFESQGQQVVEVGRTLGYNRKQCFWRLSLPMSRPWLMGGLAIVLMEVCADFGAVSTFNVDTWTTSIYNAWFALFSLNTASQLSVLYLFPMVLLLVFEKKMNASKRYFSGGKMILVPLNKINSMIVTSFVICVFMIGFVAPLLQLVAWSSESLQMEYSPVYAPYLWNSILISLQVALIATAIALLINWSKYQRPKQLSNQISSFATLGYGIPGTVLAIGVIFFYQRMENFLLDQLEFYFQYNPDFFLSDSLFILTMGLLTRFYIMAHNPVEKNFLRISTSIMEAAQSLGRPPKTIFRKIHFPLLKTGIASGLLMVFVETMKELPITLMTRPFDRDTLAVKVYEWTSEGQWEMSAFPALLIVVVSVIPVWFLSQKFGAKI